MHKYSVILGNLGNTCDRFCKGYKDNPSTEEMLARAVRIPYVEGIELVGTWDISPDNVGTMKKLMADYGRVGQGDHHEQRREDTRAVLRLSAQDERLRS